MTYFDWKKISVVVGCLAAGACAGAQQTGVGKTGAQSAAGSGAETYRIAQLRLPRSEGRHSSTFTETVQSAKLTISADGRSDLVVKSTTTWSYVVCPSVPSEPGTATRQACHQEAPPPKTAQQSYQLDGTATRDGERLTIALVHEADPSCRVSDGAGESAACPPRTLQLSCQSPADGPLTCETSGQWPGASVWGQQDAVRQLEFLRAP